VVLSVCRVVLAVLKELSMARSIPRFSAPRNATAAKRRKALRTISRPRAKSSKKINFFIFIPSNEIQLEISGLRFSP
jgi:hypothetical protein